MVYETINIIAGGNSVGKMDVQEICKRAYTIGVNDAGLLAPVDVGVSMDRLWASHRKEQLIGKKWLFRRPPATWPEMFRFACDHKSEEFSSVPGVLNGRSSGHCALNFAYQLTPKKLYLFGFDFTGKPYWYARPEWHKPKPDTYIGGDWVSAFKKAKQFFDAINTEVFIVGETMVRDFKNITYEEYLNHE